MLSRRVSRNLRRGIEAKAMHALSVLALLPTVVAVLTLLTVVTMERRNESAIQNVHVMLNSELAEMKRLIAVSSRAEGVQEGRLMERNEREEV